MLPNAQQFFSMNFELRRRDKRGTLASFIALLRCDKHNSPSIKGPVSELRNYIWVNHRKLESGCCLIFRVLLTLEVEKTLNVAGGCGSIASK